jgi:GNAT superfamily N-acetyltransferase
LAVELIASVVGQRGGVELMSDVLPGGTERAGLVAVTQVLSDDSGRVVVGTLDRVVVGFATCRVDDRRQPPVGRLGACYVEPDARGVGVGRLLLDAAVSWLEERGCQEVDGMALPGDREAKNFYEAAGFKARLLTMHRRRP